MTRHEIARKVTASQARKTFGSLLDLVSDGGGDIVITRRGKPVARLVPEVKAFNPEKALEAVAHMVRMRRGVTLAATASLKDLIDEGRM